MKGKVSTLWRKIFEQRPGENDEASDGRYLEEKCPREKHGRSKGPDI